MTTRARKPKPIAAAIVMTFSSLTAIGIMAPQAQAANAWCSNPPTFNASDRSIRAWCGGTGDIYVSGVCIKDPSRFAPWWLPKRIDKKTIRYINSTGETVVLPCGSWWYTGVESLSAGPN